MSWSSSGNKCVKIYDMRSPFYLEVMDIRRRIGNKLKVEEFKREAVFFYPSNIHSYFKAGKLLELR